MQYLVIGGLWAGYCALHSFLISIRLTTLLSRLLGSGYAFYRLFYVVISLVLLIPLIKYSDQNSGEIIFAYNYPWSVVRYILLYGSLALFSWAFFFNYDVLSFFGIRQIMNRQKKSGVPAGVQLSRRGLLGFVRHPMYLALIIYLWTQTFTLMNILTNIVLTIYVVIGSILEEKKLIIEFGDVYKEYQKEVPMLIPFINKTRH